VVQVPAYREAVLARAPEMARTDPGPRSVFMGFDFHLLPHGPQLIEINTNAGGPLLNVALARAQQVCCAEVGSMLCSPTGLEQIDTAFVDAFRRDWTLQRGDMPLSRIAIVDDDPLNQYLYPEFQLFRRLFRSHGIDAVIADAAALEWREGCLWHAGQPIDLVYNRLVDFYLEAPAHAALREAYVAGGVVLTPHPHAHALYADKRNLVLLSAPGTLEQLGVAPALCVELRSGIPPTVSVSRERSEELWGRRRQLFFKPARGYGSKAAYRGDKLTRRVWEEILAADYVAQEIASCAWTMPAPISSSISVPLSTTAVSSCWWHGCMPARPPTSARRVAALPRCSSRPRRCGAAARPAAQREARLRSSGTGSSTQLPVTRRAGLGIAKPVSLPLRRLNSSQSIRQPRSSNFASHSR